MTNLKNFAARQLSKKEMNNVKGGEQALGCSIRNQNGDLVAMLHTEYAETHAEALENMRKYVVENNYNAFDCVFL